MMAIIRSESLPMRFDLLSLQLFVAVCEELSIGKAADREHIAASAVSKRIGDLETRLNASLFRRSSRGLEPTAAAQSLLHHARLIMRDVKQMEIELAGHATGITGQVRLYASVSTIIQHLPGDLREFLLQHRGVRIDIEEGTS
jgi:DNA-binding transcriptional LysR family regulator